MSKSDYIVHKEWVKEAEFEVLLLEIPKEELEDKLAFLAHEKGSITKSFYEDFVIASCVANINQFLVHIKKNVDPKVLLAIRDELLGYIYKVNPDLVPDNLIVNRNYVVKIKGDRELQDGERLLTENKLWNTSYYDEIMDIYGNGPDVGEGEEEDDSEPPKKEDKKHLPSELKSIDVLEFTETKQWWARINTYVKIKKFKEEDMASILGHKYFYNKTSFQTYVVSVCVVDSEELFVLLDDMGIPSRVAPPILMAEIYDLCEKINPFLNYENAKEFIDDLGTEDDDEPTGGSKKSPNRMSSHARQKDKKKKKEKKKFRDVSKQELLNLGTAMKVSVIGQNPAIDNIVEAIQRASVGLKDPERPIGSFLFAGRTGIGKTLTTKVLADSLVKDRNSLVNIDCSEYSADHEYAKLIGAPSGYVGHEAGGILTNAVLENPFSVVVFDEVEKASHKVHELMLQILEEGRLTDGKGQKVSFKDCIIIMTSNVGVTEVDDVKKTIGFGDVAVLTNERKNKAIDAAIKKKFKPEFINRIDAIVHFNNLNKEDYMRIIDLELYKLNENLKANDTEYKNLTLEFDKKVKTFIYKKGINEDFGARPLKRCIEKEISNLLAAALLKEEIDSNSKVKITVKKDKVNFKFETMNKKPKNDFLKSESVKKALKDGFE